MPYAPASAKAKVEAAGARAVPESLLALALGLIPVAFIGSVATYTSVTGPG